MKNVFARDVDEEAAQSHVFHRVGARLRLGIVALGWK